MVSRTTASFLICSYIPVALGRPFPVGVPLSQHSSPERSLTHRKVQRRHSNGTWYMLAELRVSTYVPGGRKGDRPRILILIQRAGAYLRLKVSCIYLPLAVPRVWF